MHSTIHVCVSCIPDQTRDEGRKKKLKFHFFVGCFSGRCKCVCVCGAGARRYRFLLDDRNSKFWVFDAFVGRPHNYNVYAPSGGGETVFGTQSTDLESIEMVKSFLIPSGVTRKSICNLLCVLFQMQKPTFLILHRMPTFPLNFNANSCHKHLLKLNERKKRCCIENSCARATITGRHIRNSFAFFIVTVLPMSMFTLAANETSDRREWKNTRGK